MNTAAGNTPLTRHELEAKIVQKAWEDEAFRAEFIADPAAAFVKYTGVPAAQLPKIVVHEEAAGQWNIVLPARPSNSGELSDDELEKVAGGTDIIFSAVTIALSVASGIIAPITVGVGVSAGITKGRGGW